MELVFLKLLVRNKEGKVNHKLRRGGIYGRIDSAGIKTASPFVNAHRELG